MQNEYAHLLTKSDYMTGLSCPTLLWMGKHERHKLPEPDENLKHIFEMGDIVGNYAKKLFPKGVELDWMDLAKGIRETQSLIKKRKTIFEAVIVSGRLYSRPDILVPAPKGKWDIIEVKSSSEVKDEHLIDLSFQKYCYEQSGLKIRKCFIMHLNKEYIKKRKINPKKLFTEEDMTRWAAFLSDGIKERTEEMFKIIDSKNKPVHKLTYECKSNGCPLMDSCWEIIPEYSVFELYRLGKKAFELFEQGIVLMKDIPEDYKLTANQAIQKKCAHTGRPHINKEKIKEFLSQLKYPLYFLDFETLSLAVPIFDGTSPFQQIPFQFSLHVIEKQGKPPKHVSFLAKGDKDPRDKFIKELKANLGKTGSIITYNASFENSILSELSNKFKKHKKWVEAVKERVVDLLIPFRNFYYYDSKQKGSASIKNVLPALTCKSYKGMEIAEGGTAAIRFYMIVKHFINGAHLSEAEIAKIRKDLEAYCGLDTEAMVLILEVLRTLPL